LFVRKKNLATRQKNRAKFRKKSRPDRRKYILKKTVLPGLPWTGERRRRLQLETSDYSGRSAGDPRKVDTRPKRSDTRPIVTEGHPNEADASPSDPASERNDPASRRIDSARQRIDPASERIDPADRRNDPASERIDSAALRIDPASQRIDSADLRKDSADLRNDPASRPNESDKPPQGQFVSDLPANGFKFDITIEQGDKMSKLNVREIKDDCLDVRDGWETARAAKFNGISFDEFTTDINDAAASEQTVADLEAQLELAKGVVKNKYRALGEKRKKVVQGVVGHAEYGDDSPLYGAMGFVRASERASGLTRKTKNSGGAGEKM
jgi:hypothetical protein